MAITKSHSFIVDGEDDFLVVAIALRLAIIEFNAKYNLTLTVQDAILERNPRGDGLWEYVIKSNKEATDAK